MGTSARSIPFFTISDPVSDGLLKNEALVLYGFNNQDNIYEAAGQLLKKGFTNISILRDSIWNLRWSSHNIKGKENLNKWVVNVPERNL